jgi:hypothetical protein
MALNVQFSPYSFAGIDCRKENYFMTTIAKNIVGNFYFISFLERGRSHLYPTDGNVKFVLPPSKSL